MKFTYQDLLNELNKLTPEQLQQPCQMVGLDRPGCDIVGLWTVPCDQINPSGDGMEPISHYDGSDPDHIAEVEDDWDWKEEPIVCKGGTIFLEEGDHNLDVRKEMSV